MQENLEQSPEPGDKVEEKEVAGEEDEVVEEEESLFRPFTRESLAAIEKRIAEEKELKKLEKEKGDGEATEHNEEDEDFFDGPDPYLKANAPLPLYLLHWFPRELTATPLEDIDAFYQNKKTFMVISKGKDIFRFSAHNALCCLSPFNPVRRVAIYLLVHPAFSVFVIITILLNCFLMTKSKDHSSENYLEPFFTGIYTFESIIKIIARGFIFDKFTYLRDPWNWLDFLVISLAYLTMTVKELGNLTVLRTFRVLRALKTVAVVPGLKLIVGAVIQSAKNLKNVTILTIFMLSIFGLVGLQVYMGVLTQKCIKAIPEDEFVNLTVQEVAKFRNNQSNWYFRPGERDPLVCSNSTGGTACPNDYICYQGIGLNPNYGYTSYDSFPWALLSSFRLMTQDFWEDLYQLILRSCGLYHVVFFLIMIFLGSFYLLNLILAIVSMSYNELQKKAQIEEMDEMEACRMMEEEVSRNGSNGSQGSKDELLKVETDGNKSAEKNTSDEDVSFPSEMSKRTGKGGLSVPGSPFNVVQERRDSYSLQRKRSSRRHRDKKPHGLSIFVNAQDVLPYADDSAAVTPVLFKDDGTIVLPGHPRLNSWQGSDVSPGSRKFYLNPEIIYDDGSFKIEPYFYSKGNVPSNVPEIFIDYPEFFSTDSDDLFTQQDPAERKSSNLSSDMKDVIALNEIIKNSRRSHSYMMMDEEKKPNWKERLLIIVQMHIDKFCIWNCTPRWVKLQEKLQIFVFDPFVELFITLCIVTNTLFMALEHHGMNKSLADFLKIGNLFFTAIFAIETALKLAAMSPKFYFKKGWNIFDCFIATLSLLELCIQKGPGLSILRSFRLLRVFKLAKSWPTLNMLISIMGKTIGALGNLTFVLAIIIFIFAVMGMQLFGKNYEEYKHKFYGGVKPRWHFEDFMHSFMIVFRVLCGEWIESMWDCMLVNGFTCVPFFMATVVIGNLIVLNLFIALLLSSFTTSSLSQKPADKETQKLSEAIKRIKKVFLPIKLKIRRCFFKGVKAKVTPPTPVDAIDAWDDDTVMTLDKTMTNGKNAGNDKNMITLKMDVNGLHKQGNEKKSYGTIKEVLQNGKVGDNTENYPVNDSGHSSMTSVNMGKDWNDPDEKSLEDQEPGKEGEVDYVYEDAQDEPLHKKMLVPARCFPEGCYKKLRCCGGKKSGFWKVWYIVRHKMLVVVKNKHFESFILFCILVSSLALALEDRYITERPLLQEILGYMDQVFTVIFALEMLLKWLAMGFKKYFTSAWCCLDFIIVVLSLINWAASATGVGNLAAFRSMRTLRALRPLRAVSRWEGMRVVVNSLVQAIPSIMNVLLVCLIFWLIFSIMGVQMFGGKYYKCIDRDGNTLSEKIIPTKNQCITFNHTWKHSTINFDNVGMGYLALFQVATFKGWMDIMYDAIDSRDQDLQPVYEINIDKYFFFVFFIIFGSFFTLNLFVGVIIDNFNEQKKKAGGSLEMFMTEDQKKYYNAMKKVGSKKPSKAIPPPPYRLQRIVFSIVTSAKFEIVIMVFLGLNMILMGFEHYKMSPGLEKTLVTLNVIFVAIFSTEAGLKIFALRRFYFKDPWNVFDFVIVSLSVLSILLKDIEKYFLSPTLLRVVRVVKVGRVLRLVKGAQGIRALLFALAMSLPALFNICLLLFLVMFIYAICGMAFFKDVETGKLDATFNFGTFFQTMILLFQMSTSAGWHDVLAALMDDEACRNSTIERLPDESGCSHKGKAIVYLVSYLVISFLIIINMYIAVILENYSQAKEDVEEGLMGDDYDMYYEIWQKFDPESTQYIDYKVLPDFLDALEPPLQVPKPNNYIIVSMDIPIYEGNRMHCVSILDALTKFFFASKGHPVQEVAEVAELITPAAPQLAVISSTLWRQREKYCAELIQNAWLSRVQWRAMHRLAPLAIESEGSSVTNIDQLLTPLRSRTHSTTSRSTEV